LCRPGRRSLVAGSGGVVVEVVFQTGELIGGELNGAAMVIGEQDIVGVFEIDFRATVATSAEGHDISIFLEAFVFSHTFLQCCFFFDLVVVTLSLLLQVLNFCSAD